MASINYIQPTYADWKTARTAIGGTTYYVEHDFHHLAIVIQVVSGIINAYVVELCRTPEDVNDADFVANIKGTATQVATIEDAVALGAA